MIRKKLFNLIFSVMAMHPGDIMNDPYLWLEERNGAQAVAWAQSESAISKNIFENDPRFQQTSKEILDIIADADKLAMVNLYQGYAYNLWQSETHQRGIWRRTTIQSYKSATPQWETLLDIDALSESENQPWVFQGAVHLPDSDRCMVLLSKNNQDASESREFSLAKKDFVKDGFFIPESKGNLDWVDENHLLVALSLTLDQVTTSGYPRKAYLWTRGEELSKAKLIFEGNKTDVSSWVAVIRDQGKVIPTVGRYVNYDLMDYYLISEDWNSTHRMPMPKDANMSALVNGKVFFSTRSDWKGSPAGGLMAVPLSAMRGTDLPADQVELVYKPTPHSSFENFVHTKDHLYLWVNENVRGQIYEAKFVAGQWQLEKTFNSGNSFYFSAADQYSESIIFQEEGYLQSRRLVMKEAASFTEIKKMKSYFNEAPFTTEQFWVKSKDGVEIPYTVVRKKNLVYDGKNPTLLYGYGGFQISRTPSYSPVMGKEWLEKGGVYVMANIRGGGEFGPAWHKAAMKENKQKSYDDFIAIAEDLIARKITSPKHLGIQGGSNGGLLVGAVAMQRPELFNAVLCQIPLLDMIRYTKLPPGASWMDEYGDPEDPKFREIILKYSPYQNVSPSNVYPKIFFQTTQADDRVHPGHARKMAARMKEYGHDVLFFESPDGGHGGGGVKLEDQARTAAYMYVYLYQQLSK
ncbi:MAG: prolyl oligopeptidase family serine peptidase [Pseudobdellovibrionaceae bacterium]